MPELAKQNHFVPRLLQGARKRKENRELTQSPCIQTESTEIKKPVDKNKTVSSDSRHEYLLNSKLKFGATPSSQLSSTLHSTIVHLHGSTTTLMVASESERDRCSIARLFSRQESFRGSNSSGSLETSNANIRENSTGRMHHPESTSRTHFTGDGAVDKSLALPPINWLGYMTRGFKFSYFQYCSK